MIKAILENIKDVVALCSVVLLVVSTLINLIVKYAKAKKNDALEKKAERVNEFVGALRDMISYAEINFNIKGIDKKAWVIAKAQAYCIQNQIDFNEEKISKEIDDIVALTKCVNYNKEDEEIK